MFAVVILTIAVCAIASAASSRQIGHRGEVESFLAHSRSALAPSSWPLDHADTARSKMSMDSGLTADVTSDDLEVTVNEALSGVQWLYTAGNNSEWLYSIRGNGLDGFFVNKMRSETLEVMQEYALSSGMYTGGMLMHANGHVYCIHSNQLIQFYNGDLTKARLVRLPSKLNGHAVLTNGMLVTSDGLLIVKQWPMQAMDLLLFGLGKSMIFRVFGTFVALSITVLFFLQKKSKSSRLSPARLIPVILKGAAIGAILWYCGVTVMLNKLLGPFNPIRFLTDGLLSPVYGGGELKIIDPLTLEVVLETTLPERCSFARMALVHLDAGATGVPEDVLTLLGDERVYQFRWRPSERALYWIPAWTRQYRAFADGTYPGTGPAIYKDNTVYFTDNTFPVYLGTGSYSMFAASLTHLQHADGRKEPISAEHYVSAATLPSEFPASDSLEHFTQIPSHSVFKAPRIAAQSLVPSSRSQAGFMFWSVSIVPNAASEQSGSGDSVWGSGSAVVWDSAGYSVQARDLHNISQVNWEVRGVRQADCITSMPAQGHVYMTDYDDAPVRTNDWLGAVMQDLVQFKRSTKHFLVADAYSGAVLANVSIPSAPGVNPSLLVPGANRDVFLGSQNGVIRVHQKKH